MTIGKIKLHDSVLSVKAQTLLIINSSCVRYNGEAFIRVTRETKDHKKYAEVMAMYRLHLLGLSH